MPNRIAGAVQSLVKAKRSLAQREQALIADLNRVLPGIGYRVIPVAPKNGSIPGVPHLASKRASRRARKTLTCQHCGRKFGHARHLGRHVAAMHPTDGARRSKVKVPSKSGGRRRTKRPARKEP
jgi:hypothetical protein